MLPKKNGFDVCRALRDQGSSVPVIILTAREEEADKVLGLEIGADDYITKPFSMRELVARVGANIGAVLRLARHICPAGRVLPHDNDGQAGVNALFPQLRRLCRGLRHARVRGFVYQYRQPPGLPGR